MRSSGWIAAFGISVLLGWKLALPAAVSESEAEKITALVGQLGSSRYPQREAATVALDQLGAAALPALRAATRSEDDEIRRRAEDLVVRIDRRVETAKLLEPKRLRLSYQDTPVPEVVRDLARRFPRDARLARPRSPTSTLAGAARAADSGRSLGRPARSGTCRSGRPADG